MNTLYYASPYQSIFKILTDCNTLVDMIHLKYGRYIYTQYPDNLVNFIISAKKQNEQYIITTKDSSILTTDPLFYIDKYFFENKIYDSKIWAIHGASVEYQKKAYLFIAPTTTGKTTLISYLSSLGFGYVAEDCILMDKKDYVIHPCTAPIKLRKGGVTVLKKEGILKEEPQKLQIGSICRYIYQPSTYIEQSLPLGAIYFIERNSHTNALKQLSSAQKIENLLKSPLVSYDLTSEYLKFIFHLSQTNCQLLQYKNMSYVADTIKKSIT